MKYSQLSLRSEVLKGKEKEQTVSIEGWLWGKWTRCDQIFTITKRLLKQQPGFWGVVAASLEGLLRW